MSRVRTYLDHNATSPLRPEAREAACRALDNLGNPSSVHREGRNTRRIVEDAREQVAALAGARPSEVVFTSGATEANNWVLRAGWDTILVSRVEHDSVLAPARALAARAVAAEGAAGLAAKPRLIEIGAGREGMADTAAIAEALLCGGTVAGRTLVALQSANNETGVIQPIAEVAAFCASHGAHVHSDAVQAAGRIELDFENSGLMSMALSAHKIGGPMGAGALIIRDGTDMPALIAGGGQERSRRSGTENIAGIAGFGAAAAAASREVAGIARLTALRDALEAGIRAATPQAVILSEGAGVRRLPNTCCFALPGVAAETLVIKLDLAGIAVSAGSACSSGKVGASHVLAAMGLDTDITRGAIRVSLGWNSSSRDIEAFLKTWHDLAGGQQRAVA
ncbi:MAG TPA: cysteine desulfurase family protein [Hyphomicrobiaceae bacterium]|nr:cysteine desulfurase family protein [Hyphomicrobiaceae bacterium]